MTPGSVDAMRFNESQETAQERRRQFLQVLPAELSERDDRIVAELASENSSAKAKLRKVYRLVDAVGAVASPFVACKQGCSACCKMNVSITALEAEQLGAASGRRPAPVPYPRSHSLATFNGVPCPFLVDEQCSVYEVRPFACRNHRSFDSDSHWCQPERSVAGSMAMVKLGGAEEAYSAIAGSTKLGGFADIRDFFPAGNC